jgi:hypothetical protein
LGTSYGQFSATFLNPEKWSANAMTVAATLPRTRLATWARRLALFSAALILVALVLHRVGVIATPLAIGLVLTGFAGAGFALLSGIVASFVIWRTGAGGAWSAVAGIAVSLAIFAWPASVVPFYLRLPHLNDVTTDTEHPPEFAALARPRAANTVVYQGQSIAARQEARYPEIQPMILDRPGEEVFEAASEAARRLKWRIVAEDAPREDGTSGHIEAEDRTLILGFIDDVIVRIENDGGTTRVDVRSLSRYGRHDFGRNATRIKDFYTELQARLEASVPGAVAAGGKGKGKARGRKMPPKVRKGAPARGQAPRK